MHCTQNSFLCLSFARGEKCVRFSWDSKVTFSYQILLSLLLFFFFSTGGEKIFEIVLPVQSRDSRVCFFFENGMKIVFIMLTNINNDAWSWCYSYISYSRIMFPFLLLFSSYFSAIKKNKKIWEWEFGDHLQQRKRFHTDFVFPFLWCCAVRTVPVSDILSGYERAPLWETTRDRTCVTWFNSVPKTVPQLESSLIRLNACVCSCMQCSTLVYVHRDRRLIRDGEPRTATSTFTQLLSSACNV